MNESSRTVVFACRWTLGEDTRDLGGARLIPVICSGRVSPGFVLQALEWGAGGVMMIPIPKAGTLTGIHGLDAARAAAGVDDVEITARINYPLVPLPEGESYLGFIFARGSTPEAVEESLRRAHACLKFEIESQLEMLPAAR